jgi:hypothetical protein
LERGKEIFRDDTFGNETFWTDTIQLDRAIRGEALGGTGGGLTPAAALGLGLKVDSHALDNRSFRQLRRGSLDLESVETTLELLRADAVVGLRGTFGADGNLSSVGITCALCHATVDDSLTAGVGQILDGWANRDLDVGRIVALAPNLEPVAALLGVDEETVRLALTSWGPGKFDAALMLDGKAFRPDGKTAATLIPPAYGLAGVNLHTWTGWGSVTHWNALVANLEMHGVGTFYDPRLNNR